MGMQEFKHVPEIPPFHSQLYNDGYSLHRHSSSAREGSSTGTKILNA